MSGERMIGAPGIRCTFRQNAEEFYSCLAKVGMDREKFIEVLDCLINGSDQSDAYVHVSWF